MEIAIRYHSKTGNTRKLAKAMGEALGAAPLTTKNVPDGQVDLLILGASIYGGQPDGEVARFIGVLDGQKIKRAAVFATSATGNSPYEHIKGLLEQRGIEVVERHFICLGKFMFLMNIGRPNKQDIANCVDFACAVVKEVQGE